MGVPLTHHRYGPYKQHFRGWTDGSQSEGGCSLKRPHESPMSHKDTVQLLVVFSVGYLPSLDSLSWIFDAESCLSLSLLVGRDHFLLTHLRIFFFLIVVTEKNFILTRL